MNCLIEARQLKKPSQHKFLSQPILFIHTTIHYEVHYLPDNLYMNLESHHESIPFPLHYNDADDHLLRTMFTALLSHTLIPESHFNSILTSVFSKLKSLASDLSFSCYNFIPLSMSVRVIRTQQFNPKAQHTWQRILDTDISSNLPAMEKSVRELEKVVYNGQGSGLECPICLEEFKVGQEMTMMPCFHCYHGGCIVKWLKKSHLCPSCRFPLPVCQVDEGDFPFFKRNHSWRRATRDKIRKTARARMCAMYQIYRIEHSDHLCNYYLI